MLSGCNRTECVEADDFGFASVTVSSRYPDNTSSINYVNNYQNQDMGAWLDSGYSLTGLPVALMVTNWQWNKSLDPTITNNTGSDLSAWSPWFGSARYYNYLPPSIVNLRACYFGTSNDTTCFAGGTPDTLRITNAPCLMTQGIGLYGLLQMSGAVSPNSNVTSQASPQGYTFHVGAKENNAGLFDPSGPAGGIIVSTINNQDISNYAGGKLFFKMLDLDYSDNAGQYIVKIKSGVHNLGVDPFKSFADKFQQILFSGDGTTPGIVPKIYGTILTQTGFLRTVKAILTLYIFLTGAGFLIGIVHFTAWEILNRIIKILIIAAMLSPNSWNYFSGYLFNIFIYGANQIIGMIEYAATGGYTSGGESVIALLFAEETLIKLSSLLWFDWHGIVYILMFLFLLLLVVYIYLKAWIFFITAFLFVGVMLSLTPIFLCFMLFGWTNHLYKGWLDKLIAYSMQPIILFTALAFLGGMIRSEVYNTLGFKVCLHNVFKMSVSGNPYSLLNMYFPESISINLSNFTPNSSTQTCSHPTLTTISVPKPWTKTNSDGSSTQCRAYECQDQRFLQLPYLDPCVQKDLDRLNAFASGNFIHLDVLFHLIVISIVLLFFNDSALAIAEGIFGGGLNPQAANAAARGAAKYAWDASKFVGGKIGSMVMGSAKMNMRDLGRQLQGMGGQLRGMGQSGGNLMGKLGGHKALGDKISQKGFKEALNPNSKTNIQEKMSSATKARVDARTALDTAKARQAKSASSPQGPSKQNKLMSLFKKSPDAQVARLQKNFDKAQKREMSVINKLKSSEELRKEYNAAGLKLAQAKAGTDKSAIHDAQQRFFNLEKDYVKASTREARSNRTTAQKMLGVRLGGGLDAVNKRTAEGLGIGKTSQELSKRLEDTKSKLAAQGVSKEDISTNARVVSLQKDLGKAKAREEKFVKYGKFKSALKLGRNSKEIDAELKSVQGRLEKANKDTPSAERMLLERKQESLTRDLAQARNIEKRIEKRKENIGEVLGVLGKYSGVTAAQGKISDLRAKLPDTPMFRTLKALPKGSELVKELSDTSQKVQTLKAELGLSDLQRQRNNMTLNTKELSLQRSGLQKQLDSLKASEQLLQTQIKGSDNRFKALGTMDEKTKILREKSQYTQSLNQNQKQQAELSAKISAINTEKKALGQSVMEVDKQVASYKKQLNLHAKDPQATGLLSREAVSQKRSELQNFESKLTSLQKAQSSEDASKQRIQAAANARIDSSIHKAMSRQGSVDAKGQAAVQVYDKRQAAQQAREDERKAKLDLAKETQSATEKSTLEARAVENVRKQVAASAKIDAAKEKGFSDLNPVGKWLNQKNIKNLEAKLEKYQDRQDSVLGRVNDENAGKLAGLMEGARVDAVRQNYGNAVRDITKIAGDKVKITDQLYAADKQRITLEKQAASLSQSLKGSKGNMIMEDIYQHRLNRTLDALDKNKARTEGLQSQYSQNEQKEGRLLNLRTNEISSAYTTAQGAMNPKLQQIVDNNVTKATQKTSAALTALYERYTSGKTDRELSKLKQQYDAAKDNERASITRGASMGIKPTQDLSGKPFEALQKRMEQDQEKMDIRSDAATPQALKEATNTLKTQESRMTSLAEVQNAQKQLSKAESGYKRSTKELEEIQRDRQYLRDNGQSMNMVAREALSNKVKSGAKRESNINADITKYQGQMKEQQEFLTKPENQDAVKFLSQNIGSKSMGQLQNQFDLYNAQKQVTKLAGEQEAVKTFSSGLESFKSFMESQKPASPINVANRKPLISNSQSVGSYGIASLAARAKPLEPAASPAPAPKSESVPTAAPAAPRSESVSTAAPAVGRNAQSSVPLIPNSHPVGSYGISDLAKRYPAPLLTPQMGNSAVATAPTVARNAQSSVPPKPAAPVKPQLQNPKTRSEFPRAKPVKHRRPGILEEMSNPSSMKGEVYRDIAGSALSALMSAMAG